MMLNMQYAFSVYEFPIAKMRIMIFSILQKDCEENAINIFPQVLM